VGAGVFSSVDIAMMIDERIYRLGKYCGIGSIFVAAV